MKKKKDKRNKVRETRLEEPQEFRKRSAGHLGRERNWDKHRYLGEFPGGQNLWGRGAIRFLGPHGSCRERHWENSGSRIGGEQGPGTGEV